MFPGALIVAGEDTKKPGGGTIQENKHLTKAIKLNNNPIMFVQRTVLEVMSDISQHVAKLNAADVERTRAAIDLYEPHIDVQQLIEGL